MNKLRSYVAVILMAIAFAYVILVSLPVVLAIGLISWIDPKKDANGADVLKSFEDIVKNAKIKVEARAK